MTTVPVRIQSLAHSHGLPLPDYATALAAGVDLMAALEEDVILQPLERRLIATGIAIALPPGYEAQIRPRSGLALRHGISLVNTPGTIDADYRGEIKVLMINLGQEAFTVNRGMRIAQMVVAPVSRVRFEAVDSLDDTQRSHGGFGSTGIHTPKAAGA